MTDFHNMTPLFYRGPRVLKGHGFGGVFASLFRRAIPILKTAGRYLGRRALHTGFNTLESVIDGNNAKEALRKEMEKTRQRIISDARTKFMTGKGLKRKRLMTVQRRKRLKKQTMCGGGSTKKNKKKEYNTMDTGLAIVPKDFFD